MLQELCFFSLGLADGARIRGIPMYREANDDFVRFMPVVLCGAGQ